MTDNQTSTKSVVSPLNSTLQELKKIAALFDTVSYKGIRRVALALRLTVGLGQRKLTGSVISSFLDFALVPGSEAHTRLFYFVNKTDEHDKEVDTASSSTYQASPPKHLNAELEIYCFFIVLLFLIDQKNYNEAKLCSAATIGRLKSVNRRIVDGIASKLYDYYYLRCELPDDLAEIRSTLLALQQLATLQNDSSKRTKLGEGGVEEEACPRPPGVKADKRKAKKTESESSSMLQFQRMWEIKEKDIAARESLSKQRILASLIAKTELSENEINLKNKLIDEMLG